MKLALLASLLLLSSGTFAQPIDEPFMEKVTVYFNCYLPTDGVSCDELKSAYFGPNTGLEASPESGAFLSATVRSTALNNVIEYQYTLKARDGGPEISFK